MPEIHIHGAQEFLQQEAAPTGPQKQQPQRPGFGMARKAYRRLTEHPDYRRALKQRADQKTDEREAFAQRDRAQSHDQARLDKLTQREIEARERMLKQQRAILHRFDMLSDRARAPFRPSTYNTWHRAADTLEYRAREFAIEHGQRPYAEAKMAELRLSTGDKPTAQQTAAILRLGSVAQHAGLRGDTKELVRLERELKRIAKIAEEHYKFDSSPSARANYERVKDAIYVSEERVVSGLTGHRRQRTASAAFAALMNAPNSEGEGAGRDGNRFGATPMERFRAQLSRFRGGFGLVRDAHKEGGGGLLGSMLAVRSMEELGSLSGGAALLGGAAALGVAGVGAVASAPFWANGVYDKLVGTAAPWMRYRLELARQARAGGFSARKAQHMELRSGVTSYAPTFATTRQLQAFGLSPQQVATINDAGGVVQQHAESRLRFAQSVREASMMPGNVLGENTLAQMVGGAVSSGAVGNTEFGWNQYFRQLQRVQATATAHGIDASKLSQNWQTFMQSAASQGVGFDMRGLSSLYRRLMGVSPAGRSGALQSSILAGTQQASGQLGYGGPATMAVAMALGTNFEQKLGSAAGIQKFTGMTDAQFAKLTSTPAGKRTVEDIISAARFGNEFAAMQGLGALVQNDPGFYKRVVAKISPMLPAHQRQYYSDLLLSRVTNTSLSSAIGWQSAPSRMYYHGTGGPFTARAELEAQKYAKKYHIPLAVLKARWMMESSGGQVLSADHGRALGVGMVRRPAVEAYNKAHDTGSTMAQVAANYDLAARISAWYLARKHEQTGKWGTASLAYHHDLGGLEKNGVQAYAGELHEFNYLRRQYAASNTPIRELRMQANVQTAHLKEAQYAYAGIKGAGDIINSADEVIRATFHGIATAGTDVAKVFEAIAKRGNTMLAMQHLGVLHEPVSAPTPWGRYGGIPNDHSGHVTK